MECIAIDPELFDLRILGMSGSLYTLKPERSRTLAPALLGQEVEGPSGIDIRRDEVESPIGHFSG